MWLTQRNLVWKLASSLNDDQWNIIPQGSNNSVFWNLGHIAITHQLLCYSLSGIDTYCSDEELTYFRKGAMPAEMTNPVTFERLKELFFDVPQKMSTDIENGVFKEFSPYHTSVGISLNNLDEAFTFNLYHEGIHLGVIMKMIKEVK